MRLLVAAILSLMLVGGAEAVLLEATSQVPWEWTDFSLEYQGQLSPENITYFSGVTYLPFMQLYQQVVQVPGSGWVFSGYAGEIQAPEKNWEYTQTPLPSSILLLGSGVVAWMLTRMNNWMRRGN